MENGVYTSANLEIAQTKHWAICFYCNPEKSIIGAELYNGVGDSKRLVAICERFIDDKLTVYAYQTTDAISTNDYDGVYKRIGSAFEHRTDKMKKIDSINIVEPYEMATVNEKGIGFCLKQWRMGTSCWRHHPNGFTFQMVTNKIEYVFSIQDENCNIYCGASVNVPDDNGMFGGGQYFRFRNFGDNSAPFCRFVCDLGKNITVPSILELTCDSGSCIVTNKGLYWVVKRFTNDEIVLHGCGGSEYVYRRNNPKSEFFGLDE